MKNPYIRLTKRKFPTIHFRLFLSCLFSFFATITIAQETPTHRVIPTSELAKFLKEDSKQQLSKEGVITPQILATYLREKSAERYFYDWRDFEKRFENYNQIYSNKQQDHAERALDHLSKFSDSTHWVLPFNYLNGKPVNAYALRHLARQHKMVDIAFHYYYEDRDPAFLRYFVNQLNSLNVALERGAYEKIADGNGVYEAFRSGYRALNWLQIHHMFLGQDVYTDEDQLRTIATLLQQGAHLYHRNKDFHPGNHQTRGMSALAMIAILLRDFEGTDKWFERAMQLLQEHLAQEINDDGFQFERSVHYHMSDIANYYYVYQLAKISNIPIDPFWEEKLRSLFVTLTQIAYPDKSAPVLQDDTEIPWGEKNNISGALTLGYLLFEDPVMGYFAKEEVEPNMYWYLSETQLSLLANIKRKKPGYGSLALPTTGYYIMREGWRSNDHMMIISAGLDAEKPDHQHGDMLGIQAMANGKVILPNYQVRYSLKDFDFFKNSMVKNVALVDEELQGKQWTSNQGGSGFGKFKKLPQPQTISWKNEEAFDLFTGTHDGFESMGVAYSRQVIYVKNKFWIVKDNFQSQEPHVYKQVWQGHYTDELGARLIRSTFDDASGCDILQLRAVDKTLTAGSRGKEWTVISKSSVKDFSFITIIYPYQGYSNRINEEEELPGLKGWSVNQSDWKTAGNDVVSLSKDGASFFFGVTRLSHERVTIDVSEATDLFIKLQDEGIVMQSIGDKEVAILVSGIVSNPLNSETVSQKRLLAPGEAFTIGLSNK